MRRARGSADSFGKIEFIVATGRRSEMGITGDSAKYAIRCKRENPCMAAEYKTSRAAQKPAKYTVL